MKTQGNNRLESRLRQLHTLFTLTGTMLRFIDRQFVPNNPKSWIFSANKGRMLDFIMGGFFAQGAGRERSMYLAGLFAQTFVVEALEHLDKKWGFGGHFNVLYFQDATLFFPETEEFNAFICAIYTQGGLKQGDMLGEWEVIEVSENGEEATIVWGRNKTQVVKIRRLFFDEYEQKWAWVAVDEQGRFGKLGRFDGVYRVNRFINSLDAPREN